MKQLNNIIQFAVITNDGAEFYYNGVKIATIVNETLVLEHREYSNEELLQLTKFMKKYKKSIKKLKKKEKSNEI